MSKDRGKAFQLLLQDTLKPFFDRSIMAKYPPGSIFKPLVSLIALEEGLTWPSRYIPCSGAYYYGDIKWGCHHHAACTSLALALQHSCNSYFFQLTRDIIDQYSFHLPGKGLNTFAEHLYDFGLGAPIGIDYPTEKGGNVPSAAYYDKIYKRRRGWRSPTIMSIGIGQGEIQLTTLQMANLATIIANRGSYYIPHLIKAYKDNATKIEERFQKKHTVNIKPEYFVPVIDGMQRVVTLGTGRRAYISGINIAGKTGTSQNPHGEDHSVFFGFAPVENPTIAVAVIVENAGKGAEFAAPIASLVIEKYLRGKTTRPALEVTMEQINTLRIKPKRKRNALHFDLSQDSTKNEKSTYPVEELIPTNND
jgi:penicillin-binding protein 2